LSLVKTEGESLSSSFFLVICHQIAIAKRAQQNALRIFQFYLKIRLKNPPPIARCRLINSPNFCLSPAPCELQLSAITINAKGKRSDHYYHDITTIGCTKTITS
jgi:hypothetical protein